MNTKTVFITGAAGNLGQAVKNKFLEEGFQVVGTQHHSNNSGLSESKYELIALDLLDEAACESQVKLLLSKYKAIDVAVLTAGGFVMGDIAATDSKTLFEQYQLNFQTAYHVARPIFLAMLQQNKGCIFLIGAIAGLDATKGKGLTAYSLSKSLLFQLAEIMNAEAVDKNVRVIVIVPTIIDTPQNRKSMPNANFSRWDSSEKIAEIIFQTSEINKQRATIIEMKH